MKSKSIFKSKTFWVNVLTLGVQAVDKLAGTGLVPEPIILIGLPIANCILRAITKGPVHVMEEK